MNRVILLVEDEENNALLLHRMMLKVGITHPLREVRSGREAMDYLEGVDKFSNRHEFPLPELILLDLELPVIMGLEVLKWIRGHSEHHCLPVIVLTSSDDPRSIQSAYQAGANAYLVKPFHPDKFESMIRALNDFWLVHNHFAVRRGGRSPAFEVEITSRDPHHRRA